MGVLNERLEKASAKEVGFAICEAMGLPTNFLRSITINVEPKSSPSITITRLISKQGLDGLKSVVNHYHFVEVVPGKEGSEDDE